MNNQDRPNLFSYATSELSQDAFICWLAAWADPKWKDEDPKLHQAGFEFIISMIHKVKRDYNPANIKTVKVQPQVKKLDILIEINKEESDSKLAILIEDKTHTSNHSDQLNRYYKQVSEEGYNESQMIPLYFKTGYQSKFDTLGVFETYLRKDFLKVLRHGKVNELTNAIYDDFLQHLEEIDTVIQQFSTKELIHWQNKDWIGFFMVLYDSRPKLYEPLEDDQANWNYVANPAGGFFGFWWYFKGVPDEPFVPYLQLEQHSLCFKIMVEGESDKRDARDKAYQKIKQMASQLNAIVERPERMGNGKFMTVARWKDDYRVFRNGQLDLDATLENLKKAQQILDTAFSV
ncbi:PD-(D/E)XK nuclease family protein [Spirosoma areae]